MSGAHPEPSEPRIIRKKKVQGGGGHGGAWKVAYADFVTAMMALFIVLWIMGQSQSVRQNVAQYFKNPGLLPGASGLMETSDMGGDIPTPGHSQDLQTPSPITPDLASELGSLEEVKKRITEVIAQLPELSRLKQQVALEITNEGLRIELLDQENSHFFDLASANLKRETQDLLKLIAQELGKLPNFITVEGHTDSRPYGTKTYTNWELSADRANAARRVLEDAGVNANQVTSVRGCADRFPRNQQDPLDYQNRRVSILVMFKDQTNRERGELQKIQDHLKKTPKEGGLCYPNGSPAAKGPPPGATSLPTPGLQGAPAGQPGPKPDPPAAGASQPAKAGSPGAMVYKSTIPPPGPQLGNQVQEEVWQLLQPKEAASAPQGAAADLQKGPRLRLGW
ncbi:MAG: flagellar motor protein MotB [Desulfobaccales bacterium]